MECKRERIWEERVGGFGCGEGVGWRGVRGRWKGGEWVEGDFERDFESVSGVVS